MTGEAIIRRRVVVHGRVQDVFYRDSMRERALALGVTGWVRNRSDGAVEAVLEGEPEVVEQVLAYCRTGPSGARVEEVDSHEEKPERLSGFAVR